MDKSSNSNLMSHDILNKSPLSPGSIANSNNDEEKQWPGETQTFISATTDMSHFSNENLARFPKERFVLKNSLSCDANYISTIFIILIAYMSPVLFIVISYCKNNQMYASELNAGSSQINILNNCLGASKTDCHTNILSIVLKLFTLFIASYWLFWQKSRIIYPRTHWPRIISLGLLLEEVG